jgi:hypothetical protein
MKHFAADCEGHAWIRSFAPSLATIVDQTVSLLLEMFNTLHRYALLHLQEGRPHLHTHRW